MSPLLDPNERRPYILDASVAINLLATGQAIEILSALGARFMLEDMPARELIRHPLGTDPVGPAIEDLKARGLLERMSLQGAMFDTFIDLVGAPPHDDLDDGEAGVLAFASHTSAAVAVLDESRARRIASTRWPSLEVTSTADLLADERVLLRLGAERLQNAVVGALIKGRMRVLPHRLAWVCSIVPPSRLPECRSLPREYRRV